MVLIFNGEGKMTRKIKYILIAIFLKGKLLSSHLEITTV
jgi:hypothetical protein